MTSTSFEAPVNPLAAAYCADQAAHVRTAVIENVPLARDTYRVRLACPEIAHRIVPGQFLMVLEKK